MISPSIKKSRKPPKGQRLLGIWVSANILKLSYFKVHSRVLYCVGVIMLESFIKWQQQVSSLTILIVLYHMFIQP